MAYTTHTYNRENWSGETSEVVINENGTFKDSVYGRGKWKHTDHGDGFEEIIINIDGVGFRAVKLETAKWYCQCEDLELSDNDGIVACLKVASNTM